MRDGEWNARVDLALGPDGFQVNGCMIGAPAEPGHDWIAGLLRRRPAPSANVLLLTSECIPVLAEIAAMTAGGQLRDLLAMEAEHASNVSGADSLIGFLALQAEAGLQRFWICQAPWELVTGCRQAVASAGCRLLQLGHPGGIPLESGRPQLEHWLDASLFHAGNGKTREMHAWSGAAASAEASAFARAGHFQEPVLRVSASAGNAPGEGDRIDLREEPGLRRWAEGLAAAHRALDGWLCGVPLIDVPPPPIGRRDQVRVGAAAAAAAALLIGFHYFANHLRVEALRSELDVVSAPARDLAEIERQLAGLRAERTKLEGGDGGADASHLLDQRKRITALLDGIASGQDPAAVILAIRPDGDVTRATGLSLSPQAPQAMSARMAERLGAQGWRVSLVRRTAKLANEDGGPWEFEIAFFPVAPAPRTGPASALAAAPPPARAITQTSTAKP